MPGFPPTPFIAVSLEFTTIQLQALISKGMGRPDMVDRTQVTLKVFGPSDLEGNNCPHCFEKGCGAVWGADRLAVGGWWEQPCFNHINVLKLGAIFLAVQEWASHLQG